MTFGRPFTLPKSDSEGYTRSTRNDRSRYFREAGSMPPDFDEHQLLVRRTNIEGAKSTCFIASPDDAGLQPLIDKIGHKVATPLRNLTPVWWKAPTGKFYWHQKMTEQIRRARLVIAVCSDPRYAGGNPNVAFEVGAAHALGKALVLLVEEGVPPAADISPGHYVPFDRNNISAPEFDRALGEEVDASLKSTHNIPSLASLADDELYNLLLVIDFWMDIVFNLAPLHKSVGTLANMTVGIAYEKPVDEAFETVRNAVDQYCDLSGWSTVRDFIYEIKKNNKKIKDVLDALDMATLLPKIVGDTANREDSTFWEDVQLLLKSHETLRSLKRTMLDGNASPAEKVKQSRNELLRLEQFTAGVLLPAVQCLSALLSEAGFDRGSWRQQG